MKIGKIILKVIALVWALPILYSDGRWVLTNLWLPVNFIVTRNLAALLVEVISTSCSSRTSVYICDRGWS